MNNLTPVETYTPPKIPTLAEKPSLHVLPLRWAKNIAVTACIGVLGATTLAGCMGVRDYTNDVTTPFVLTQQLAVPASNYSELDFEVRMHGGGSGSAWYVVHLTEQEMHNILREHFAAMGFYFADTPPDYTAVGYTGFAFGWINPESFGLDWFDAQRNAGLVLSREHFNVPSNIRQELAEQTDITIGVINNPSVTLANLGRGFGWGYTPTDETAAAQLPVLVARLQQQASRFMYDLGYPLAESNLQYTLERAENSYNLRLSEQQAIAIIREQLQAAGLVFDDEIPNVRVQHENTDTIAQLLLFNAQANTGIALTDNVDRFGWNDTRSLQERARSFTTTPNIHAWVFFNPVRSFFAWEQVETEWGSFPERVLPDEPPNQSEIELSLPELRAQLIAQVQSFIHHLQSEGIL